MYLLDTHALIWALSSDEKLSENAREIVVGTREVYVSIVSLWEIAIKQSIGKLDFEKIPTEVEKGCERLKIKILPILPYHLESIGKLPDIHNDPFDRLIIAQAMVEGITIITKDTKIHKYEIETLW